jgi:tetratricopeptide (TPR) repeat protein
MRWIFAGAVCAVMTLSAVAQTIAPPAPTPLVEGKRALARNDFAGAKAIFAEYMRTHPGDVQGELGLGDAELGLHRYEAAETIYRRIVADQPLTWQAHKNLVIVEAALGRWEDFDGERTVLRAARERGAKGIDRHESDVIDVITVRNQRWIVRDYFEPLGRARARYNFERFSTDGRVLEYVSLESADAFPKELNGRAVVVGPPAKSADANGFALDWYNGKSHGTVRKYNAEPKYEQLRNDFLRWQRTQSPR